MEYPCRTVPLAVLVRDSIGVKNPLCDNCKTKDCSNPIEIQKVSIFGITKDVKCWSRGNTRAIVIECQGFIT